MTLGRTGAQSWAPECQKLKMVGYIDQQGAEPFEQQQFVTAGVEGIKFFTRQSKTACFVKMFLAVGTVELKSYYTAVYSWSL